MFNKLKKWWANIESIFGFDLHVNLFNIYCYIKIFDKLLLDFNINLLWLYRHKILFVKEKYNEEKKSVVCNQIDFNYDLPTGLYIGLKKEQNQLNYIFMIAILGLSYEHSKLTNY